MRVTLTDTGPLLPACDWMVLLAERISPVRGSTRRMKPICVVTPELSLAGYPPEDLVMRPAFLDLVMDLDKGSYVPVYADVVL